MVGCSSKFLAVIGIGIIDLIKTLGNDGCYEKAGGSAGAGLVAEAGRSAGAATGGARPGPDRSRQAGGFCAGGRAQEEAGGEQAGQQGPPGLHRLRLRQPCTTPPAARLGGARTTPSAPRASAPVGPSPVPRRPARGREPVPRHQ